MQTYLCQRKKKKTYFWFKFQTFYTKFLFFINTFSAIACLFLFFKNLNWKKKKRKIKFDRQAFDRKKKKKKTITYFLSVQWKMFDDSKYANKFEAKITLSIRANFFFSLFSVLLLSFNHISINCPFFKFFYKM